MNVVIWTHVQEGRQTWEWKQAHKISAWPPFLPLPIPGDLLQLVEADPKDPETGDLLSRVLAREVYPLGSADSGEIVFASISTESVYPDFDEDGALGRLYDRLEAAGWVTHRQSPIG